MSYNDGLDISSFPNLQVLISANSKPTNCGYEARTPCCGGDCTTVYKFIYAVSNIGDPTAYFALVSWDDLTWGQGAMINEGVVTIVTASESLVKVYNYLDKHYDCGGTVVASTTRIISKVLLMPKLNFYYLYSKNLVGTRSIRKNKGRDCDGNVLPVGTSIRNIYGPMQITKVDCTAGAATEIGPPPIGSSYRIWPCPNPPTYDYHGGAFELCVGAYISEFSNIYPDIPSDPSGMIITLGGGVPAAHCIGSSHSDGLKTCKNSGDYSFCRNSNSFSAFLADDSLDLDAFKNSIPSVNQSISGTDLSVKFTVYSDLSSPTLYTGILLQKAQSVRLPDSDSDLWQDVTIFTASSLTYIDIDIQLSTKYWYRIRYVSDYYTDFYWSDASSFINTNGEKILIDFTISNVYFLSWNSTVNLSSLFEKIQDKYSRLDHTANFTVHTVDGTAKAGIHYQSQSINFSVINGSAAPVIDAAINNTNFPLITFSEPVSEHIPAERKPLWFRVEVLSLDSDLELSGDNGFYVIIANGYNNYSTWPYYNFLRASYDY